MCVLHRSIELIVLKFRNVEILDYWMTRHLILWFLLFAEHSAAEWSQLCENR